MESVILDNIGYIKYGTLQLHEPRLTYYQFHSH